MDVFSKLGFEKLTESVLGKRGSSGKAFSHGSIFGSLFFSYLCGGECLEDINVLIGQFKQRPDTLLPGADTLGRGLKELAEKSIVYKSETSDKSYSFNTAQKLNTLLLRMIRRMRLIKVGSHVDLDFDHQFVPAHKFDAKYSYKQDFGYFPGWASIGGIIVGGENHDGNTNVRFHQEDSMSLYSHIPHWFGWGILRLCKPPPKNSHQCIKLQKVISMYKIISQGIMLRN